MAGEKLSDVGLLKSLLSALFGLGILCLSIHLAIHNDFLATLWLFGGSAADYAYAVAIGLGFFIGIILIGRHIAREGVAENFYEHTPY
ncbi:MAG: hypothetical protein ACOYK2_03135 [Polynucleobacter sp.]